MAFKNSGMRKGPKRFPKKSDKKTPEEMAVIERAFTSEAPSLQPAKKAVAKKKSK